ncbi:hypothetical protein ACI1MP_37815 (plasmid) [Kitasatospora griseola]|uniref:hypothetical protein n=1 Tax=Kitasatospora griseola TaxID=2064 RepID=UPI0038557194
MNIRIGRPLWMAGVALTVVSVLSGCGGLGSKTLPPGPQRPVLKDISGPEPSIPPLPATADDPSKPLDFQAGGAAIRPDGSLILPLDAYEPAGARDVLARATTVLAQQCMRAKGLELPASLMEQAASKPPPPSVIYGIFDLNDAKAYGYRLPPQPADSVAPTGGGEVTEAVKQAYFDDRKQKKPGCRSEAQSQLNAERAMDDGVYLQDLRSEARTATYQDSRVKAATVKWSGCMKAAGFDYPDPKAPAHDRSLLGKGLPTPAGAALPPTSPAEIVVAVTDVTCKRQTQYLETVALVTAAYEKEIIEKQVQRLQQGQENWKQQVQNANKVLEISR